MSQPTNPTRCEWSQLNHLQLGRYAEHFATMRFIAAGCEVYSTEVDDRGIDRLIRYGPGRCLEIQVKGVRNRNLVFVEKKLLGTTPGEVDRRLRGGYCIAFLLFEDGREPDMYLIPGYAWLTPNGLLIDDEVGDKSVGPNIAVRPAKKRQSLLDHYLFTPQLFGEIIRAVQPGDWEGQA